LPPGKGKIITQKAKKLAAVPTGKLPNQKCCLNKGTVKGSNTQRLGGQEK